MPQDFIGAGNFGPGNSLVPPDNKPLPKPILNKIFVAIWRQWALMGHNECNFISSIYFRWFEWYPDDVIKWKLLPRYRWIPLTKGQ